MKYIFFTGMGRSGTKFVASLLGNIKNIYSEHEHIGDREFWLLSWYLSPDTYTMPFLQREKKKIEEKFNNGLFIDVNSMLQNCVPELKKVFNPKEVFHLVRDPRDVIRSLYTRRNEKNIHILPKTREETEKWFEGDKFYRICWNWATTTEKLLIENTSLIRFENVSQDYNYFKEKLLEPLQCQMSREQWEKAISKKVNKTKTRLYRKIYSKIKRKSFVDEEIPEYKQWPDAYKKQLNEICGSVMKKCGYEK